ncbi:hypothetical protein VPHF99_0113 [Vibrio phage F99]|nr:hypothetical protein MYOV056v2_p0100 [Vibrio phage 184E37.3a]QZI87053.1 hypothetical protein MYOV085v1_p0031 [Vibrio phage 355E48.1]QZI89954.1 hypothetical protein MYOV057v1_p0039 [Vibrio phage 184E37.1]
MKTILEAIQQYPDQFIDTINARANTTPSETNKFNHLMMSSLIQKQNWYTVSERLSHNNYRKPLEGVIFCLDTYSEIDNTTWHEIVNLFEEGKIV